MKFSGKYTNTDYIEFDDDRASAVFRDSKQPRVYKAFNPTRKNIKGYKVDGGIITSSLLEKCDYALYTEDDKIYLIELKGGDYKHAIDQISSSVDILIKNVGVTAKEVNGRVVLSKCKTPSLWANDEKKLIAKLRRLGGNLDKKVRLLEENI